MSFQLIDIGGNGQGSHHRKLPQVPRLCWTGADVLMSDWMSKLQGFLGIGDEEPEPQAPEPKVPLAYRQSFIGAPYPEDEPPMSPRRQKWERGWAEQEYEEEHPTKLHKAIELMEYMAQKSLLKVGHGCNDYGDVEMVLNVCLNKISYNLKSFNHL